MVSKDLKNMEDSASPLSISSTVTPAAASANLASTSTPFMASAPSSPSSVDSDVKKPRLRVRYPSAQHPQSLIDALGVKGDNTNEAKTPLSSVKQNPSHDIDFANNKNHSHPHRSNPSQMWRQKMALLCKSQLAQTTVSTIQPTQQSTHAQSNQATTLQTSPQQYNLINSSFDLDVN